MFKKLLSACAMVAVAHTAQAQQPQRPPCGKHEIIAKKLEQDYGEVPAVFAMQLNGKLLQVFVSEENNTWTMVETVPTGTSCIVAAGKNWTPVPPPNTDPMA